MVVPVMTRSHAIPVPKAGPVPIPVAIPELALATVPIPVLKSGLVPVAVAVAIPLGVVDRRAHGLPEIRESSLPCRCLARMRRRGRCRGDRVTDLPTLMAMADLIAAGSLPT